MKTIHKYPLEYVISQEIILPKNFIALKVGLDVNNQLCFWAMVDRAETTISVTICCFWTEESLPEEQIIYIDSLVYGNKVLHYFFKV